MNAFKGKKFHEDMNDHLVNPYDTIDYGDFDDDYYDKNDDLDLIDIAVNNLCLEEDEKIVEYFYREDEDDHIPSIIEEDIVNDQYSDHHVENFPVNDSEHGEQFIEEEEEDLNYYKGSGREYVPNDEENNFYVDYLEFDDINDFSGRIHSPNFTTNSNTSFSYEYIETGHQSMATDENVNADYQEDESTSTVDPMDPTADDLDVHNNDDVIDAIDIVEIVDHVHDDYVMEPLNNVFEIDAEIQTDFPGDPVEETDGNTRDGLDVEANENLDADDSVATDDHINTEDSVNQNENAGIIDDDEYKNVFETDHYRWCITTNSWVPKESTSASVTETITENVPANEFYDWDADKGEWIPKSEVLTAETPVVVTDVTAAAAAATTTTATTSNFENGVHTYTDNDGMKFFWDNEKRAWFPQIDDDFMAVYQMNYGFVDNTSASTSASSSSSSATLTTKELSDDTLKMPPPSLPGHTSTVVTTTAETETLKTNTIDDDIDVSKIKRKMPPEPPKWFELPQEQNTKVYVSNLPLDITEEEFIQIMSKCGMIFRDPQINKLKVKLYTHSDTGELKGDGLCHYIKVESVDLAINILNESDVRGHTISVQRATFQMRGEYNPALKPKKKKKDAEKLKKIQEKLFDWRPEKMRGERSKHERTVIIKNLFEPELFEREVDRIIDFQNNLRDECGKCGTVRKVVIYDRHPDGVAQVNMTDPEEADVVVQMMHRRFFGDRRLVAELWDGKTKYKIDETEAEAKERLSTWSEFLEKDETAAEEESKIVEKDKENKDAEEDTDDDKYFEE